MVVEPGAVDPAEINHFPSQGSGLEAAMVNAVVAGVVVAALAIWALGTDRDIGGWFIPAH